MNDIITNTPKSFHDFPGIVAGITIRRGTTPAWQDVNFGFRSLRESVKPEEYAQAEKSAMDLRDQLRQQTLGDKSVLTHVHQTHSDSVVEAPAEGDNWGSIEGDAIVTNQPHNLLTLLVADCAGIILYDPNANVLGTVHSGWRGTKANIVSKTIARMTTLGAQPAQIYAYVSPAICVNHYEVGEAFLAHFDKKYLPHLHGAIHFDNAAALHDQLAEAGVSHIETDPRCTYQDDLLHSYRRDGQLSGRFAIFAGLDPR
jgi:YfiH family protein